MTQLRVHGPENRDYEVERVGSILFSNQVQISECMTTV